MNIVPKFPTKVLHDHCRKNAIAIHWYVERQGGLDHCPWWKAKLVVFRLDLSNPENCHLSGYTGMGMTKTQAKHAASLEALRALGVVDLPISKEEYASVIEAIQ